MSIKEMNRNISNFESKLHDKAVGKRNPVDSDSDHETTPYKIKHFVKLKAAIPKEEHLEALRNQLPPEHAKNRDRLGYINEIRVRFPHPNIFTN
jgi:hypothetical protein